MSLKSRFRSTAKQLERAYSAQGAPLSRQQHEHLAQAWDTDILLGQIDDLSNNFGQIKRAQEEAVILAGVRERQDGIAPATGFTLLTHEERAYRNKIEAEAEANHQAVAAAEAQQRQAAWNAHRRKIEEATATARRDALLSGKPTLLGLMPLPSTNPPDGWHPDRKDGHVRCARLQSVDRHNPDGTRTLRSDVDMISGRRPGAMPEPSPEEVFRAEAQR